MSEIMADQRFEPNHGSSIISEAYEIITPKNEGGVLFIVDHASNHVPHDISLGVDEATLDRHVAVDIGVDTLTRQLISLLSENDNLGVGGVFARVSRLVVDLNRDPQAEGMLPIQSDDVSISGNQNLTAAERNARALRFYHPYHNAISHVVEQKKPNLLVAVHSFTPQLASTPDNERPWHLGVLYNQDERAAKFALSLLADSDFVVGDNLPYSGKQLNYTMDRHAEARGIPYLSFEVRQDLVSDNQGLSDWSGRLAPIIKAVHSAFSH